MKKLTLLLVSLTASVALFAEAPQCRVTVQTDCKTIGSKQYFAGWQCPSCSNNYVSHTGTVIDTNIRTYVRYTQGSEIGLWTISTNIVNGPRCTYKVETICESQNMGDPAGCHYVEHRWMDGAINQSIGDHGDPCQTTPPDAPEYQVNVIGVDANGDLIEEVSLLQPLPTFQVEPGLVIEVGEPAE